MSDDDIISLVVSQELEVHMMFLDGSFVLTSYNYSVLYDVWNYFRRVYYDKLQQPVKLKRDPIKGQEYFIRMQQWRAPEIVAKLKLFQELKP